MKTPRDAPTYYAHSHEAASAWAAGWNDAKRDNLSDTAPHTRGRGTSKQAAANLRPRLTGLRGRIFGFIVSQDYGATCSEVVTGTGIIVQTASTRLSELQKSGLIKDSGKTRKGQTGSEQIVWVA